MSTSPTRQCWRSMYRRCLQPECPVYSRYGGRGISICDRWLTFENFLDDMGVRPPDHTLDRIDNERGYSKGNCRWATWEEQNRNRRNTVMLTHKGVRESMPWWSEKTGISYITMKKRRQYGWTDSQMVTTQVAHRTRGRRPGKHRLPPEIAAMMPAVSPNSRSG